MSALVAHGPSIVESARSAWLRIRPDPKWVGKMAASSTYSLCIRFKIFQVRSAS